ncbi:MAG: hypothetical protein EP330_01170 [Deltaproteobacteria bacterium]|nr:MAG: hypothetical protein EP330_01170 [Deltaproteobacteria bacterium]
MTTFPRTLGGQHFDSLDHLADQLERHAKSGAVAHPGQRFPAEVYEGLPADEKALVGAACAQLVRTSPDERVLLFCSMCGKWNREAFEPALLDRIEQGPGIPEADGTQGMNLYEALTETFAWGRMDPAVVARARQVLHDHAPPSSLLQFLAVHGSAIELATAIEEAAETEPVRSDMIAYAVGRLALKDASQVLMVLPSLAGLTKATREAIVSNLQMFAGSWFGGHGDAVRRGLGL